MPDKQIVVLVHGWSVTSTETYGELAARLKRESSKSGGVPLDVKHIWLTKYISFKDEVRLEDVSKAFAAAIRRELGKELDQGRRFACITHSTGGPVVRDWWNRFYLTPKKPCPMSHLIMLAPANFGSALAQLGKSRISRLKSWSGGVEPGQGILDWLELGSSDAWELNKQWICNPEDPTQGNDPVFPFVLTGQTIERKFYDQLNTYTGELGSDGVVRVAAANMNATYLQLVQEKDQLKLDPDATSESWPMAFALIKGCSHSGEDKGILRSIENNDKPHPSVRAILDCLKVRDADSYDRTRQKFVETTAKVHQAELVEHERRILRDRYFIHDQKSMVIIRVRDDHGYEINDYDFLLTGPKDDPNRLPTGFFSDSQRNSVIRSTLTYFLSYDLMAGCDRIRYKGKTLREKTDGIGGLGIRVRPRPDEGFVHYDRAWIKARKANILKFLKPNQTTMLDIVLNRVVHQGVVELVNSNKPGSGKQKFKNQRVGKKL